MNAKKLFLLTLSIAALSASANEQDNFDPHLLSNNSFTRNGSGTDAWHFCDSAENPGVCKSMNDFLEYYRSSQTVLSLGVSNWFYKIKSSQLPVKK
jgi:hypothetical protein